MKLKTLLVFPIILIIVFGGIAVANGLGVWHTESSKIPMLVKEGEFEGSYDPGDIRGSYSFQDIEDAFNIPASLMARAFDIKSENPGEFLAKDLEAIYGETQEGIEIGTGAIRTFVACYIGMNYEGEDGIPKQGVDILKAEGKWSDELEALYEGKIIDLSAINESAVEPNENTEDNVIKVEETSEHDDSEQLVKGNTSVTEIISWGISLEKIEEILTVTVENENMLVRDICTTNDLNFGEIKTSINLLLEQ